MMVVNASLQTASTSAATPGATSSAIALAWCSLVWVASTDAYIYLVSTGAIRDLNTW